MNRNEEYSAVISELENTPPALEYTISRAKAKMKARKKIKRFFTVPIGSILTSFITFIIVVNLSTTFAMACGKIPLIKELAAAVAFSPSLSAAVENEYVQPINLEQVKNGITMRVEYVIIDQKQLNIFYTLNSNIYSHMYATPFIRALDDSKLEGYCISSGGTNRENNELRHVTVDFTDRDMPEGLLFTCKISDNGSLTEEKSVAIKDDLLQEPEHIEPDYITEYTFDLDFDPHFTHQGKVIELNQSLQIDNQDLTLSTVEIYPSHIRLNLIDDESNTSWLKAISFYFENEKGERFEGISNGITATGSSDSPMMASHRLESSFFSDSKKLTIYVNSVTWLDKGMETVKIDLKNKTAEALPQDVNFDKSERVNNNWLLSFSAKEREENACYQLFMHNYYDDKGNEYHYNSWSTHTIDSYDNEDQTKDETPVFSVEFVLKDYLYDTVYLSPAYSRIVEFSEPIVITEFDCSQQ